MGCDIHMFVEYKHKVDDVEKWVSGDYFKMNPLFGLYEDGEQFEVLELHGHRNYQLFATLAGVMDHSGDNVPISEPKGLPIDVCSFVKAASDYMDGDGHSHSWLTLKELKNFQNTNPTYKHSGIISTEQIAELEKGIFPDSWCQGTNRPNHHRREWGVKNESIVPLIEKMQGRAKELLQYDWQPYDPLNDENIRIVFFFAN